jgi:hypothetical protein
LDWLISIHFTDWVEACCNLGFDTNVRWSYAPLNSKN